MEDSHDVFIENLKDSTRAVTYFAAYLANKGNAVQIAPVKFRETHKEWKGSADSGDLFILQRLEVKRLSVNFTSCHDWPFNDRFIVCAKHAWDRAEEKPIGYAIMNKDMTHYAYVNAKSHEHWFVEHRIDSRYKKGEVTTEFYFCPLEHVTFCEMSQ